MSNAFACTRFASSRPLIGSRKRLSAQSLNAKSLGPRRQTVVGALQLDRPTLGFSSHSTAKLISKETVTELEDELYVSEGVAAVRRFNSALCNLTSENWEEKLRPVFNEWCYNLESFNPAFTAVLLKVQQTVGVSDYCRRDDALKNLIQPLAGEYGMHNGQEQAKTHRQLFCEFYTSLFRESVQDLLAEGVRPIGSELMFEQMMRDILGGGECITPVEKASYALGYNLAIEYLAQWEKGTMLESFQTLDKKIFSKAGLDVEWTFLEVHAVDEVEHAEIGHDAVLSFVPQNHMHIVKRAMHDHDKDFAVFYNKLASMIE
ncbi:hypothetical protein BSKO_05969 [Bryopsis sp. KO-2023]|nr:hypothetical protein BSKO_05969 [Bryopsis sp. KO-2023]